MVLYYLIGIVNRDRAEAMSGICRKGGASLVLTELGNGTATRQQLSLYGLDRTEKAMVVAVTNGDGMKEIFHNAKRQMYIDIPGNGILLAVPVKSVGGERTLAYLTDSRTPGGGVPDMNFEYELIVVILNEGFSDVVMDAARSAGAGGGTVLHARGTGAESAEKFLGVSLASEKDVVYIVAGAKEKAGIMKAIEKEAGTGTKAGAICFSLPVSAVEGLRRLDEEE